MRDSRFGRDHDGDVFPAPGWVVVYETRRRGRCHELALVLASLSIPHFIADGPRNAALLLVPPEHAEEASRQIRGYEAEEQVRPSSPAAPLVLHGRGITGVLAYAVVLVLVFMLERDWAFGIDWLEAGRLSGAGVRAGEWWRVITPLTLHADGGHLVANLLFGAFFGLFAGQYFGSGVAWAVILLAAGFGNWLDVLLLPPSHSAIGASTAVFAALGLIGAFIGLTAARVGMSWAHRSAPVVGAVVLLAYIGTGDAQTDAVAHLTGFLAGLSGGALLALTRPRFLSRRGVQVGAGAGGLGLLAACWWLAIAG